MQQKTKINGFEPEILEPIPLDHPILPGDSSYAISKTASEQYIALSGIDFVSFRLANAYGPRNLSGPLPTFYHRLTNDLKCFVMDTRRDFMYVQDLIDVAMMAVDGKGERGYYSSLLMGMAVGDTIDISDAEADSVSKIMVYLRKRHQRKYMRKQIKKLGVYTGAVCVTRLI